MRTSPTPSCAASNWADACPRDKGSKVITARVRLTFSRTLFSNDHALREMPAEAELAGPAALADSFGENEVVLRRGGATGAVDEGDPRTLSVHSDGVGTASGAEMGLALSHGSDAEPVATRGQANLEAIHLNA